MNLPSTVAELIDLLDEKYPHRCIAPDETPEAAHRRAGQREVVDFLIQFKALRETAEVERHRRF